MTVPVKGDLDVTGVIRSATIESVYVSIPGALATGSGAIRLYFAYDATITNVHASVGTAPTSTAAVFDVNKNGTTIFTTQGNRPSIAASANVDATSAPDVTAIAAGDFLTVDVDTPSAAADATIRIDYRRL